MTISTHVLDLQTGSPAREVRVTLFRCSGDERERLAEARTDADGRIAAAFGGQLSAGEYELMFDAGEYYKRTLAPSFYAEIPVRFLLEADRHYHVPLLISPFGYSTYRGS